MANSLKSSVQNGLKNPNITVGCTEMKRKTEAKCGTALQYSVPHQVILFAKDTIEIKGVQGQVTAMS